MWIGDRRLLVAPPVTGGARLRTRALGPDIDAATLVDLGETATTGADRDNIKLG